MRAVSYKLLVESFNNKYKNLSEGQKSLLREYINNINNTGKLNEYVENEITKLVNELKEVGIKVSDKVTKIKLAETMNQLAKIANSTKINDNHITSLIMCYELQKELSDVASTIGRSTI